MEILEPVSTPYLTAEMATRIELEPRTTGHWRNTAHGALRHPTPNGIHDPLSVLAVLDVLQNLKAPVYFTTARLVQELEAFYPHILWDPVTVGRILGEIADEAGQADPKLPALKRTRTSKSAYWNLFTECRAQWRWLYDARVWMQAEAERIVAKETKLRAVRARTLSPWTNLPHKE